MEKIMTGDGETKRVYSEDTNTEIAYGNTRRQLDRQSEVIDYLAKLVSVLEDRIEPILQSPTPMAHGPEEDSPYLPQLPMRISEHTDRIEDILHRVSSMVDRIDL